MLQHVSALGGARSGRGRGETNPDELRRFCYLNAGIFPGTMEMDGLTRVLVLF